MLLNVRLFLWGSLLCFSFHKSYPVCFSVPPCGMSKRGFSFVHFSTSLTFTWSSFHLKIRTPLGSNTPKHSSKPFLSSAVQSFVSFPYFLVSQEFSPTLTK